MLWSISAVLLGLITMFWGIGAYTRLTRLRKAFTQAFIKIDVQIKQRHRAMHALAEKLARTQTIESGALEGVLALYRQGVEASERLAASPSDVEAMQNLSTTDGAFTAALGKLMTDIATHTDADLVFRESRLQLAEEHRSMDNRIAFARQRYNQTVTRYNTALQQFPGSVIARLFAFKAAQPWKSDDAPIERRRQHRNA